MLQQSGYVEPPRSLGLQPIIMTQVQRARICWYSPSYTQSYTRPMYTQVPNFAGPEFLGPVFIGISTGPVVVNSWAVGVIGRYMA